MRGSSAAVLVTVIGVGLALVVSACAVGGGGGAGSPQSTAGTTGKTFPVLKVVLGTTDYMDPGLAYGLASWQLFQDVYLGLVVKAHVSCETRDCARIEPGLATTIGTVTKGGRDYKFTLRKGLKYSDGTPIRASDFKNSIIRDFNLDSRGIGFYANIVGVDACEANPTKCSGISGIVTNDSARTIEIELKQPESDFEYILSLPFTSLVPSSTPHTDQENPPPPASGPYYIASYKPNRAFVILRNPNWKNGEIPAVPNGNPDKVLGTMTDDVTQSARYVESGQYDYDENLLPSDLLSELQSKYGDRIKFFTTPSTYYFFMNERTPPFNDLKVRRAVNYAVDRQLLVKLRGGLGKATENFLPPSYPQYKKISPYPYNLQKAKQLVAESGTKGMKVTVYTISDVTFDQAAGEYLQGVLESLGYDAQIRELAGSSYFTIIGSQKTKAQIGFADWFEDYPYPTDWFNVLQYGPVIHKDHNNNNSNVDIPSMNQEMYRLAHLSPNRALSASANAAWAKVDRDLMVEYATEVPYLNGILTSFFSSRMDMSCDVFDDSQDDFAQFCLK